MAPICLCHESKCPIELVIAVTRRFFCPVSDLSISDCSTHGLLISFTSAAFSKISEISLLFGVAPWAKEDNEEASSNTIDNSTSLTRTLPGREN